MGESCRIRGYCESVLPLRGQTSSSMVSNPNLYYFRLQTFHARNICVTVFSFVSNMSHNIFTTHVMTSKQFI